MIRRYQLDLKFVDFVNKICYDDYISNDSDDHEDQDQIKNASMICSKTKEETFLIFLEAKVYYRLFASLFSF